MAEFYTHLRFGRELRSNFSPEINSSIDAHPGLFEIGCQGPDFLFYDVHRFLQFRKGLGNEIHRQSMTDFIRTTLDDRLHLSLDDAQRSYYYGMICHFVLDSFVHPPIGAFEKDRGYDHHEMETELDRYFMEQDGTDPLPYRYDIEINDVNVRAMASIYGPFGLTEKDARRGLRHFYKIKNLFQKDSPEKIRRFLSLLKVAQLYKSFQGKVMRATPQPSSVDTNPVLEEAYLRGREKAPSLCQNFYSHVEGREPLDEYFNRNFNGDLS